ncbi:hypothetical protein [Modestobacter roseus]|uniref:Serine/threonine protein kinase n=1 Tax=Modestobacter roseus TaxID=1181884 RepID=A0A562ITA0_9ACTN|nr:hypothetical protein [Modestobacter roseus]MQA35253.1 hypothetical protein [Modestobacter roseus]TWH74122.1 hypothetical protein JD78_02657 [Modestobacter roseus]
MVITAAAVVALLAGLAVGLVLWLGSDGDEPSTSLAAPSTDASTSASRPAPPSTAPDTGGFTAAPSVGIEEFLATLPADFTDCGEADLIGDGDVAAAACGPASSRPGPTDATFLRYPDVDTLDDVFAADVTGLGLEEWGAATDCTEDGYGEWVRGDAVGGLLACGLTDGTAFVYWTDDEFLTEGVVSAPGESQDDVVALYEWWVENSDFVG